MCFFCCRGTTPDSLWESGRGKASASGRVVRVWCRSYVAKAGDQIESLNTRMSFSIGILLQNAIQIFYICGHMF
jgi:hypothetical protein